MKKIAVVLTLASLLSVNAYAEPKGARIIYDFDFMINDKPAKMEGRYFIKKGFVRVEMDMAENPMGQTVVIKHANPEKTFLLFPERKTYTEQDASDIPQVTMTKPKQQPVFKATGKRRKVAGYSCEVMERRTERRHEEMCINQNLIKDLATEDLFSTSTAAKKSLFPSGIKGFPLEYTSRDLDSGTMAKNVHTLRVREFHRENIKPGLFQVPKGYKKQDRTFPDIGKWQQQSIGKGGQGGKDLKGLSPEMQKDLKALQKKLLKKQQELQKRYKNYKPEG